MVLCQQKVSLVGNRYFNQRKWRLHRILSKAPSPLSVLSTEVKIVNRTTWITVSWLFCFVLFVSDAAGPLTETTVPAIVGLFIALTILSFLLCFMFKLFTQSRWARTRSYADAGQPPPTITLEGKRALSVTLLLLSLSWCYSLLLEGVRRAEEGGYQGTFLFKQKVASICCRCLKKKGIL